MIGLFLGLPLNMQSLFAEKKSDCLSDLRVGSKIAITGPDTWELSVTLLKPKSDDKFLKEKIGLLKLEAAEEFTRLVKVFYLNDNKGEQIKEDKIEEDTNIRLRNYFLNLKGFLWNDMKLILISMKSYHCFDDDSIVFSGTWTSNSLEKAFRHINLEKAWFELLTLLDVLGEFEELEDGSIFVDEMFNKKFPMLEETDDPEYVRNAIKYLKRVRDL